MIISSSFLFQIEWQVVAAIAENCRELEELGLAGIRCVDDYIVDTLADNCQQLTFLSIKGCQKVG